MKIINKSLFVISMFLLFLLSACHSYKTGNKHISVSLKLIEPASVQNISVTTDIIKNRLIAYGIPEKNIATTTSTDIINIDVIHADNPDRIIYLITTPGKLEFWETYEFKDIFQFIDKADKILKDSFYTFDNISKVTVKDLKVKTDTSESLSLLDKASKNRALSSPTKNKDILIKTNPLFAYLRLSTAKDEEGNIVLVKGPDVGWCEMTDTAVVNKMLSQSYVRSILPKDLKFAWTVKPFLETTSFKLIALKYPEHSDQPRLTGEVITDAKKLFDQTGRPEISISMNGEGARIWKDMTSLAVTENRSIAIVLDNCVITSPFVESEISDGHTNLAGNFTKEEAEDLAIIMKLHQLPVKFTIKETKIMEESK